MPTAPSSSAAFVVQEPRRLSESFIWGLQRKFYDEAGPEAWKPKGVPNYVTTNAFIARAYARLVRGFLRDLLRAGAVDTAQPVYVIELAGGPGRFAFLFLRALQEARAGLPELEGIPIRYVLTDIAQSNLDAARRHGRLRPLVEQGLLDFARYDMERDGELALQVSGQRIGPGTLANPAVAVANYAFDSVVQDVFRVRSGALQESLASVVSTREEPTLEDPLVLDRLSLRWEARPLASTDYYEDPVFNRVLASYAGLADTAIAFPIGALRCIRTVMGWSGGRLLVVCGDKCFSDEDELLRRHEPVLTTHGGCFSITVNFHALAAFFEQLGGQALRPSRRDHQFKVGAWMAGVPATHETRLAYREEIDAFGPGEFFHLSYSLRKEHAKPSPDVLLATFKLADWDPELFISRRDVITQQVRDAPSYFKDDLRWGLRRVWDRVFPMHRNFTLELAWVALAMDEPREAIRLAQEAMRVYGVESLSLTVLGLAHGVLGEREPALQYAERALAMDPDNTAARQLKQTLATAPRG